MKRCVYPCFAALTLLLVSSCSLIDFAYNNAPAFVANEFDDAFALSDEQGDALEARLQTFFAWHRSEELPRYQALLDRAAAEAADGVSRAEFLALNRDIRAAWRRAANRFVEEVADLAATLTPEQIERYQAYSRERAEEHEDYLDKSLQQREIYRAERNLDRFEKWFGDFDEGLENRVRARLQQLPDLYAPWIEYRAAQNEALVTVLRERLDAATLRARLKRVLLDVDTEYAQAFEIERSAYWQAFAAALVDISGWVSSAQRQKAIARLQNYARVASRLNRQS